MRINPKNIKFVKDLVEYKVIAGNDNQIVILYDDEISLMNIQNNNIKHEETRIIRYFPHTPPTSIETWATDLANEWLENKFDLINKCTKIKF